MVLYGQAKQRGPAIDVEVSQFRDGTPEQAADEEADGPQLPPLSNDFLTVHATAAAQSDILPPPAGEIEVIPDVEDIPLESVAGTNGTTEEKPDYIVQGERMEAHGYYWLFTIGLLLLIRLLVDPTMVRRPLLDPNLTTGGLIFIGCSLIVFQLANVITGSPTEDDLRGPEAAESLIARRDAQDKVDTLNKYGPGLAVVHTLPTISTGVLVNPPASLPQGQQQLFTRVVAAKTTAILAHLAIVLGIVLIGYRHFDNIKMGVGAAALYLMLPYMAEMTGRVNHALPGALLVWAIVCYRRPLIAGMFLGLAAGVIYYPFFLLPLWISFYWQRGLGRFLGGVAAMLAVLVVSLMFTSADFASFWLSFKAMFGLRPPAMEQLEGIWRVAWDEAYRVPILAAFIALSGTLALWPPRKNLGTLLSCSGAMMLAAQFWHGYGGGTFMAWYLPLLLLTVFRPNLEDRVAVAVLDKGRWPRVAAMTKAA